jgi:hypothetical protein
LTPKPGIREQNLPLTDILRRSNLQRYSITSSAFAER